MNVNEQAAIRSHPYAFIVELSLFDATAARKAPEPGYQDGRRCPDTSQEFTVNSFDAKDRHHLSDLAPKVMATSAIRAFA